MSSIAYDKHRRALRIEAKRQRDHRPTGTFTQSVAMPAPQANDEDARLAAWLRNAQFTDVSHLLTEED